eukprot:2714482-Amphidinium_carterae.1
MQPERVWRLSSKGNIHLDPTFAMKRARFYGKDETSGAEGWLPVSCFEGPGINDGASEVGEFTGCLKSRSQDHGVIACPALKAEGFPSGEVQISPLQLHENRQLVPGCAVRMRVGQSHRDGELVCQEIKVLRGLIRVGAVAIARKSVRALEDGYL